MDTASGLQLNCDYLLIIKTFEGDLFAWKAEWIDNHKWESAFHFAHCLCPILILPLNSSNPSRRTTPLSRIQKNDSLVLLQLRHARDQLLRAAKCAQTRAVGSSALLWTCAHVGACMCDACARFVGPEWVLEVFPRLALCADELCCVESVEGSFFFS